jgi:hypothetical protein
VGKKAQPLIYLDLIYVEGYCLDLNPDMTASTPIDEIYKLDQNQ